MTAPLDARLTVLRAAAQDRRTMLVVLTNGPKLSAPGKGSRFG